MATCTGKKCYLVNLACFHNVLSVLYMCAPCPCGFAVIMNVVIKRVHCGSWH